MTLCRNSIYTSLSSDDYLEELHGDKICLYLIKSKTSLCIEDVDAAIFSNLQQPSTAIKIESALNASTAIQVNAALIDASLQRLIKLGLITNILVTDPH